jgi:glycosyltransferase involved in cell wall biosynthesis
MLATILAGSRSCGHEIELVFFEDGSWPAELAAAGYRVEVLPAGRLRELHRLGLTMLRLARLLRRRRPDLIVNWIAKSQLYCAPAAVLAGMPGRVVWWQHEIASGHWMDRLATLLPAAAVGCSSEAAARAQERLRPHRRTFVVWPGTATPPAAAPGSGLPAFAAEGVPVVGIVGRLQPWKGQDRLLRAHRLLRDRGLRLHTVIVGGDAHGLSSEYAASLPGLVKELGLEDEVTLTGQVPDPGPYIERMDILVNASDPEPFGIVLLEAMARGVPVVAVASGGPLEIVINGETGVLAGTGEPAALAEALGGLLQDGARRRAALGQAGQRRFTEHFTEQAMRERLFSRFQDLVDQRGRGR